jgi:DNA mismatch repair protein MutS2
MIYPESIEEKLGFDVIRQRLLDLCVSDLGRNLVKKVSFQDDPEEISSLLLQVDEFMQLIAQGSLPDLGLINDINAYLDKSSVGNNWLSGVELYKISANISSTLSLVNYLGQTGGDFDSLIKLKPEVPRLPGLNKKLLKSVDKDGEVLSSASNELKSIRHKLIAEEGALRRRLGTIFKQAKANGHVPESATVSVRDGRMVIPIKAANKKQLQGFIHDESATGNIVFIEPAVILEANNNIRQLQIDESREIKKILLELTEHVAEQKSELVQANSFLAIIDMLRAKAKLASVLGANKPQLSKNKASFRELKHPLLVLANKKKGKKVVSHDLELNNQQQIILISGPNAGGKSVVLKSVGLNQMMLQSGILPCCRPDSEFRVFTDIFIDIGDEQSIDHDLSTYSSHLQNMSVMLANASNKSLILIDEFGSGTDPAFGGAIAETVMQRLKGTKCFGVITTHFSNLKLYADKTAGIINAAMVFDLDKLLPLYELELGHPGSSYSLEVASQSGLPADIIAAAREGIGTDQIDVERLLRKLAQEKRNFDEQKAKLVQKDEALTSLKTEYEQLKLKLEERQKDIINSAKEEASAILSGANKQIEKTIRHIKENKAEKKETKKVRQSLQKFAQKVTPDTKKKVKTDLVAIKGEIVANDHVLIIDKGVVAEVLSVKGKKAKLLIGELQSVVSLDKLQKISKKQAKQEGASRKNLTKSHESAIMADFSPILDIRGTRAVELLPILQQFLDQAVMLNQSNLKIIHGRGNGVLRQLVREELQLWSQISSYENEHVERGGDGATVIILK